MEKLRILTIYANDMLQYIRVVIISHFLYSEIIQYVAYTRKYCEYLWES